jgi:hypothetical protein
MRGQVAPVETEGVDSYCAARNAAPQLLRQIEGSPLTAVPAHAAVGTACPYRSFNL